MSIHTGYFIEVGRQQRLEHRRALLSMFESAELPRDTPCPGMTPPPWCEDPVPPEQRRVFTCPLWEACCAALFYYSGFSLAIRTKASRIVLTANSSDARNRNRPTREAIPDQYRSIDDPEFRARLRSCEQKNESLKQILPDQLLIGLDPEGCEDTGFKFLVFETAEVSDKVVRTFLETARVKPRGQAEYAPFAYTLVRDSKTPLADLDMPSTVDKLDSLQPSCFVNKPISKIITAWETLLDPVSASRSLIATHTLVVLGENAANGRGIVTIISANGGDSYTVREASFEALESKLLPMIESLSVGLNMFEVDDEDVIQACAISTSERRATSQ